MGVEEMKYFVAIGAGFGSGEVFAKKRNREEWCKGKH